MDEALPNGERAIKYYPGARTRWDYFSTEKVNKDIKTSFGDGDKVAAILRNYILDSHPDVLDLAPAIAHRFNESMRVMEFFPKGKEKMEGLLLSHFQEAEKKLEKGYTLVKFATFDKMEGKVEEDGNVRQRIILPESVKRRALVWNRWVQQMIKDANIEDIFSAKPQGISVRLAEGELFHAGNLMFEVAEGLARTRTPSHYKRTNLDEYWNLNTGNEWGAGLNFWFVMSHIVEKDLLKLSQSFGEGMIDGMKLTPEVYAKAYVPILELIELNPGLDIKGVLSEGTWIYSSELGKVFPDQEVSKLHDIAGKVVDIGTAKELGLPEQIDFATRNPLRKKAYEEGKYNVEIAARFIDPKGMREVIERFGLS